MAFKLVGMMQGIIRSSDKQVMVSTGNGYQSAAELGVNLASVCVPSRYGVNKQLQVLSDRGFIDADIAGGDEILLTPPIVVSSAAPNNTDGRPDGTIYIQTA